MGSLVSCPSTICKRIKTLRGNYHGPPVLFVFIFPICNLWRSMLSKWIILFCWLWYIIKQCHRGMISWLLLTKQTCRWWVVIVIIFKFSCSNWCHISSKPAVTSTVNFLVVITRRIKAHSLSFIKSCLLALNFSDLCFNIFKSWSREFPGGPVVRTCAFTAMAWVQFPSEGITIPQDTQHSQKTKTAPVRFKFKTSSQLLQHPKRLPLLPLDHPLPQSMT